MRILYVDIDSLRPDHLGCYGYHRNTSPTIDSIAKEGVKFTNFYSTDTPCLPSRTALFGGNFGFKTGVVNHGGEFSDIAPRKNIWNREFKGGLRGEYAFTSLGKVLRDAGYYTASISPFPERHTAYQVWFGFTETYDTGKGGLENADEVYPVIKKWLENNGEKENWFLHVNMWDPHTPYDTPEDFGNPFKDDPIEEWVTEELIQKQRNSFGPHSAREVPGFDEDLGGKYTMGVGEIKNTSDAKEQIDAYDTGIKYADFYLNKVFEDLKKMNLWDDTAIIISADHGENQGELNVWGDHQTADHITNRVPLIIRWPGITDTNKGSTVENKFYNLDLTSTISQITSSSQPDRWDGINFTENLTNSKSSNGRDYLVISHGAWSCQRSVRWDNWLLIRTYDTGLKDFPKYMLFDIEKDPHELNNLADQHKELVAHGMFLIDEWIEENMYEADRGDPLQGVIREGGPHHANIYSKVWNTYVERLEKTDRKKHADNLRKYKGKPFSK